MKKFVLYTIAALSMIAPGVLAQSKQADATGDFAAQTFELSKVMLHDVVNPPAASRFYAYAMLTAYQVVRAHDPTLPDYSQKFNVPPTFTAVAVPDPFDPVFAATYAMLELGKQIMPSGYLLEEKQQTYTEAYQQAHRLDQQSAAAHQQYAEAVAQQVLQYAKTDGYNKLSTYTQYSPTQQEGAWYPTPPAYIAAVEPNWESIRSFFLDSATQFAPPPPAPFSLDSTSSFHRQMMEVYETGRQLTREQKEIASFWDCNPFAVQFSGHMAIGLKKISPGGHWMGITGIACKKAGVSFETTVMAHTLVALTLHDAFISCWQEKYRSDRIRPETAINRFQDATWRPLLQTPPFPEYTSGHSVISTASAVVLTALLGENFTFDDASEVYFGLPIRKFPSFYQAADEAAISRLYGGIHFRDAIEAGVAQGKAVGHHILQTLYPQDLSGR